MSDGTGKDAATPEHDLRQIPKWARRYAQNRALPVLVFFCFYLAFAGILGGLSLLTVWAAIRGRHALAAASGLLLCASFVALFWFAFLGGARLIERISRWLYRTEGDVAANLRPEGVLRKRPLALYLLLSCCFAEVALGVMGLIPIRYMQPISAIYAVPFMVYLGCKLWEVGSPFMFLWPLLYGLHAILLVAGAPIYFEDRLESLNMLIPTAGYGLLSALAAHVYSRFALRKLRRLAAGPGEGPGAEVGDDG